MIRITKYLPFQRLLFLSTSMTNLPFGIIFFIPKKLPLLYSVVWPTGDKLS